MHVSLQQLCPWLKTQPALCVATFDCISCVAAAAAAIAATCVQAKYLRLLQPQQLPTLFKSSLTAQLLSSLMTAALSAMAATTAAAGDADTAQDQLSAAQAVGLLEGLVSVPRFEMMAMSLGSRDKPALKQVWEAAAAAVDSGLQTRLAAVRPKYRV
jgi:hypothetical protein